MILSKITLQSGEVFFGHSPEWQRETIFGEVVFTTGMVGYVESLTDPSYAGQILTFTYPLIGNYGVPEAKKWESSTIHAKGIVIRELSHFNVHHESVFFFLKWLEREKVSLITGVDTRALTKTIRTKGAVPGALSSAKEQPHHFVDFNQAGLCKKVSIKKPIFYGKGKKRVILVDCGSKESILRSLQRFPIEIKRVPCDYDYTKEEANGILLSNGPGDPSVCHETIGILQKAMEEKKRPIFGICLGSQIMALAAGMKTYKLKYGHRSQNQPCIDTITHRCYLTSQNHGYAIDENTLPNGWRVSFKNINDGTVEGIEHEKHPFFAVQFHPEASPGPTDTHYLFEKWYDCL
jgi:carbamoyl-phosphate synthase small subunit